MQSSHLSPTPFPTIRTHSFSLIKDYVDEQVFNSIKNSKVSLAFSKLKLFSPVHISSPRR